MIFAEYEAWREKHNPFPKNLTGEFLAEREAKFNTSRIADALEVLNSRIPRYKAHGLLIGTDADALLGYMVHVRDILEGDRPFIEDSTITGATTRTYL